MKHLSHWSVYLISTADPKPSSLWHYSGQPGILQWTPDRHTPDTVYYQCYTHRCQFLINILVLFISHTTHTQMFMLSYNGHSMLFFSDSWVGKSTFSIVVTNRTERRSWHQKWLFTTCLEIKVFRKNFKIVFVSIKYWKWWPCSHRNTAFQH